MKVLVTRPRPDAEKTAAALRNRGHVAVLAPLLDVQFRDDPEIAFDGVQAVLLTSANGARALARRTARRDVPVFAVGAQTAEAARQTGFANVRSADGDARALADAVPRWAKAEDGALLHASGAQTAGNLAARLRASGFTVRAQTLYDVVPAARLPAAAADALASGDLESVMFFSPRSARIFSDLVGKAGLGHACGQLVAFCISEACAQALGDLPFRAIWVAARPDQDALLDLAG
jgi:uroporphyrinogen-III synthase